MANLRPHGMDEVGWEKKMGVIGDFRAREQVLTMLKVDKENWVA